LKAELEKLRGLHWDGEYLHFIEQTLLPHQEKWIMTDDWQVVVDAIRRLAIRGAPAIGVAGAFAAVLAFKKNKDDLNAWNEILEKIEHARPTAVNLSWAVGKIKQSSAGQVGDNLLNTITSQAEQIAIEDEDNCLKIAENGLEVIPPGSRALTHCNAGALVSYGIGTAVGVLRQAFEKGLLKEVYACEARPLGQGARLTMWELHRLKIPCTLLCDSAAGRLMQEGKIDLVMVGADRIAMNGDTANKIGTFNLAVLANRFSIPFYVAAPITTFDLKAKSGENIPIEYRHPEEVRKYGHYKTTEGQSRVYNPAFDITPGELITGIISENNIAYPPYNFS